MCSPPCGRGVWWARLRWSRVHSARPRCEPYPPPQPLRLGARLSSASYSKGVLLPAPARADCHCRNPPTARCRRSTGVGTGARAAAVGQTAHHGRSPGPRLHPSRHRRMDVPLVREPARRLPPGSGRRRFFQFPTNSALGVLAPALWHGSAEQSRHQYHSHAFHRCRAKGQRGSPGLPMGAAPMAYVLWQRHLSHNPRNPKWPDRDRFVLSAGHGSMLLYSLLHLTGYDLSLDDIKTFRQWARARPATRNPFSPRAWRPPPARSVRAPPMRSVWPWPNAFSPTLQQAGHTIVDHFTYALVGDGDMMEGITHEAASLAGHLGLASCLALRRQQGFSRRPHLAGLYRGRGQAFRGLRLASPAGRARRH